MPYSQLAAHHSYNVAQVRTVADRGEKRTILFINGVPISALHLRIVEVLTLDSPRLAVYIGPFGAWIHAHLEPRNIQRPVTHLWRNRDRSSNDSPAVAGGLI